LGFNTQGGAYAYTKSIELYDDYNKRPDFYQSIGETQKISLNQFAMIFMRKDPPVDEAYLNALKILNLCDKSKVKLVNPADKLQILNEKLFAFEFPDLIPNACYTSNKQEAFAFTQNYHHVILKPIDGMGGKGIFISDKNDPNFSVIFETLSGNFKQAVLIQEFIPDIIHGDKRILIINGHIFDHALARIPASGQIRGNLAAGGSYQTIPLSKSDYHIAKAVAVRLKHDNIALCGIDVIGDKLTEINITSPTCFQELYSATGRNPFDLFFENALK
jgi:glutathione synthase